MCTHTHTHTCTCMHAPHTHTHTHTHTHQIDITCNATQTNMYQTVSAWSAPLCPSSLTHTHKHMKWTRHVVTHKGKHIRQCLPEVCPSVPAHSHTHAHTDTHTHTHEKDITCNVTQRQTNLTVSAWFVPLCLSSITRCWWRRKFPSHLKSHFTILLHVLEKTRKTLDHTSPHPEANVKFLKLTCPPFAQPDNGYTFICMKEVMITLVRK